MAALVGSTKQIVWASEIRTAFFESAARFSEGCAAAYGHKGADDKGRAYQLTLFAAGQLFVEEMEAETSAAEWIGSRGDFKNMVVRRLFNAANKAAAAARATEISEMLEALVALARTSAPAPMPPAPKTRRSWSSAEKAAIIAAYDAAPTGSKWATLADAGIPREYIYRWRQQVARRNTTQPQNIAA